MKKFLLLLITGLFAISVQAQWYSRSYGVNSINDLTEAQLNYALQRAEVNVKTGKILTFSGIGAFAIGTVIAATAVDDILTWDDADAGKFVAGGMLMYLGMGSTAVGIPFWIVGSTRKKKIEVSLLRFNSSAFTGYKQPEQFGLSVKVNF
jgi:hypothetical protein